MRPGQSTTASVAAEKTPKGRRGGAALPRALSGLGSLWRPPLARSRSRFAERGGIAATNGHRRRFSSPCRRVKSIHLREQSILFSWSYGGSFLDRRLSP